MGSSPRPRNCNVVPAQKLPKLTTTSFALLGLLQRRPWSAYELTGYMRNSILRAVWPRAESHLYSEPKLLLKRGYVEAREERNGARKRTVYSITPAGTEALQEWLQQERASEFRFEYELLVRLAFAESVDADWVGNYLAQARSDAFSDAKAAYQAVNAMIADGDLRDYPGTPFTGAILHLIVSQLEARLEWVEGMQSRFASLDPDRLLDARAELGPELYADASARLAALLETE